MLQSPVSFRYAETLQRVAEAALQVLVERLLGAGLIVVLHRLIQDAPVASLLQIRRDAHDEPVRIVVEIAADVVVALLRKRLVLVISAATGKLCPPSVVPVQP